MAQATGVTGIITSYKDGFGWVTGMNGKSCAFKKRDFTELDLSERICIGLRVVYDIVKDPDKPKFHKAIIRSLSDEPNFSGHTKQKLVIRKIDLMQPRIEGDLLFITAHYYENEAAKDDVRLYAYAGDKNDPMVKPLEDLPGKDEETFDLYTWNYGIAQSNVLLSALPTNCSKITVIGPGGVRVSKEIPKKHQQIMKKNSKTEAKEKKPVVYDLQVDVISSNRMIITITADRKPISANITVRATGNNLHSVKFKHIGNQTESDGSCNLESDNGRFEIHVDYTAKCVDLDIECQQYNLRDYTLLLKEI